MDSTNVTYNFRGKQSFYNGETFCSNSSVVMRCLNGWPLFLSFFLFIEPLEHVHVHVNKDSACEESEIDMRAARSLKVELNNVHNDDGRVADDARVHCPDGKCQFNCYTEDAGQGMVFSVKGGRYPSLWGPSDGCFYTSLFRSWSSDAKVCYVGRNYRDDDEWICDWDLYFTFGSSVCLMVFSVTSIILYCFACCGVYTSSRTLSASLESDADYRTVISFGDDEEAKKARRETSKLARLDGQEQKLPSIFDRSRNTLHYIALLSECQECLKTPATASDLPCA